MALDGFKFNPETGWNDETVFPDYPQASEVRGLFQKLFDQIKTYLGLVKTEIDTHTAEKATLSELGHVNHATLSATILSTGWTGSAAPYSQAITVTDITANDNPIIDIVLSGAADYATEQAILAAWGNVYRVVTGANTITVYATAIPTVDIPIVLKVVR